MAEFRAALRKYRRSRGAPTGPIPSLRDLRGHFFESEALPHAHAAGLEYEALPHAHAVGLRASLPMYRLSWGAPTRTTCFLRELRGHLLEPKALPHAYALGLCASLRM